MSHQTDRNLLQRQSDGLVSTTILPIFFKTTINPIKRLRLEESFATIKHYVAMQPVAAGFPSCKYIYLYVFSFLSESLDQCSVLVLPYKKVRTSSDSPYVSLHWSLSIARPSLQCNWAPGWRPPYHVEQRTPSQCHGGVGRYLTISHHCEVCQKRKQ